MLEWLNDPQAWVALATLTALEVVLGVDNLLFLTLVVGRLPAARQAVARRVGLALAMLMRIVLLLSLAWLARLEAELFTLAGEAFNGRDLVLLVGGLFLIAKGTSEIHHMLEGGAGEGRRATTLTFGAAMAQIVALDAVFSLDSVISAVGLAEHVPVMVIAIVIAMLVMLFLAEPLGAFVERRPTVKMLALAFLLLVGVALVADGTGFHIPRGYLYFAMGFSVGVELLNLKVRQRIRARD